jgi:hypothetical protein
MQFTGRSLLLAFLAPILLVTISRSLGWPLHFPKLPNAESISIFD